MFWRCLVFVFCFSVAGTRDSTAQLGYRHQRHLRQVRRSSYSAEFVFTRSAFHRPRRPHIKFIFCRYKNTQQPTVIAHVVWSNLSPAARYCKGAFALSAVRRGEQRCEYVTLRNSLACCCGVLRIKLRTNRDTVHLYALSVADARSVNDP